MTRCRLRWLFCCALFLELPLLGGFERLSAQPPGQNSMMPKQAPIRARRQGSLVIDSLRTLLVSTEGDSRIRVLRALGWEYRKFDLLPSFDYALQSVELARTLNSKELAASLNILGIAYRNITNLPKALETFFEALKFAQADNNLREQGYAYNNIGDVYRLQGNYEWALENIGKARVVFEQMNYQEGIGYCFMRLGEIAEARQRIEEAFQYHTRAFDVRRAIRDTTQMFVSLVRIGAIHQAERRFPQALDCYARALNFMEQSGATSDVASTLARIASAEYDMGKFTEAASTAKRGLMLAQKTRTKIDIQELTFVLWRSYAALGDYKSAFEYQTLYQATRDSISNEEGVKKTAALQIRYEIERKQDELERAEKDSRIIKWSLAGGLVMALVMLGILVNRYRVKQQANAEILRQQTILTEQAREIELANSALQEKNYLIEAERELSERLLLNVLPSSIAARLMAGEKLIADRFSNVTVLFADIAGFTQFSRENSPEELVALLDTIFSEFDTIAENNHLEKIKTIGDCYMLVGGLPEPSQDHTLRVAQAAKTMQQAVEYLNEKNQTNIAMRIGMHCGEVVAGVIGKKQFSYDLWGDTVNTASRMESHGKAGKIHCTEEVYQALKEQCVFEERGQIEIKGKGMMRTWFLEGVVS